MGTPSFLSGVFHPGVCGVHRLRLVCGCGWLTPVALCYSFVRNTQVPGVAPPPVCELSWVPHGVRAGMSLLVTGGDARPWPPQSPGAPLLSPEDTVPPCPQAVGAQGPPAPGEMRVNPRGLAGATPSDALGWATSERAAMGTDH